MNCSGISQFLQGPHLTAEGKDAGKSIVPSFGVEEGRGGVDPSSENIY